MKPPIDSEVLVIEDDESFRETLKQALELEGYRVTTAENGEEGLSKLRNGPRPLLVFLDAMMPIMDGHEFLEQMRSDRELADMPVVLMSASASNSYYPSGARVYFLDKPLDLDTLLETASRLTEGVAQQVR